MRTVEAKQLRTRRLVAPIAVRTSVMCRQQQICRGLLVSLSPCLLVSPSPSLPLIQIFFLRRDNDASFAQKKRLIDRLRQPRPDLGVDAQPIDNNLDVVLDLAVELEVVAQADNLAVHAGAEKAAFEHVLEKVLVLALLTADDGSENLDARAFRQGEDA